MFFIGVVVVGSMQIRWHGHSCFEFSDGELTVVIDPHDGRSIGIKPPVANADVVLISHNHYDHNASRVIKGGFEPILSRNGLFNVKGMDFEGLPTFHDTSQGQCRGCNTMYLFEMDGIRICHCGDLGCIPDEDVLSRLRDIDILMVPTGEVFTMVMSDVKRFIELVNPTIVVPMHYRVGGLSIPISPLDDFLNMIPEEAIDYIGNVIDITPEDLTENKECWVFDR